MEDVMSTKKTKGEDTAEETTGAGARATNTAGAEAGGRGDSGNRPGADEENQGKTEVAREAERDGKAGLQEAGESSRGRSAVADEEGGADRKEMRARRTEREATFKRLDAIPEAERTQEQRDELLRTHDAEVNDLLTEYADDEEGKLAALGIGETPPLSSSGYIEVDDRDSSGNKRMTWFWRGHRYRGEVVRDQEKGPNGEVRYFLQRQGANVGAPMPFAAAIGQLAQDTEQRPA